jgi:hypothetical protein
MDKLKLVRIIAKDLEELKTLTEEFAANEDGSPLIIDLALGRARLLCQELEVLRSFSTPVTAVNEEIDTEKFEDDDDEVADLSASDPELEILHFEDRDFPEEEEITEEEEEMIVYDAEEEDEEELEEELEEEEDSVEEDLTEDEEADEDLEDENSGEEEHDDDFQEESEEDIEEEIASIEEEETEFNEEKAIEYEEQEEASLEEAKRAVQQAVREIELNDLDDEEEESVQFTPVSGSSRPVMREIPKPENPTPEIPFSEKKEPEKMIVNEPVQKERSINDVIGENKSAETNLSSGSISSLKATIGLNDRFLFIREIFNNNSEKYNTIIDQLDKMETIQQAVDYLKVNLSLQKNETSLKFVELLKRRFSK